MSALRYYCHRCGSIFEEPEIVKEDPSPSGVSLPEGVIITELCPECGSGYFSEAERCPVCGEWHQELPGLSAMCPDCIQHCNEALDELLEWMMAHPQFLNSQRGQQKVEKILENYLEDRLNNYT